MDKSKAEAIIQHVISLSDADETEALLSHGEENLTRFSDNVISQNVARNTDSLTIRVHLGKKVGRATTDKFDNDSLKRAFNMAKSVASQQDENPDLLTMLGPSEFLQSNAYYPDTVAFSPEERAETIAKLVKEAARSKGNGAGIFSTGCESVAIGNSKNLFGYFQSSSAALSLTVDIEGASGWAEDTQRDVSNIDADRVMNTAIRKAKDAQNPIQIEPGEYTVVLESAAVSDFMMFLAYESFGGLNYNEGRSFLSGRLGEKILGDNITICDDAYSDLNPGLPFDFEGAPRQSLTLIENGIAKAVVHDRITAAKANTVTTGHSLPQPNSSGPFPLNLELAAGDSNLAEMIKSTDHGILVTHFHYANVLDPVEVMLTGMTRDGTFLIENGKISKPIINMRFTDSIVKAFNQVELISKERIASEAFFAGSFVVPALKISKFNFSSVSEF